MPSAKCVCATSSLMLAKGRTTTERGARSGAACKAAASGAFDPGSRTTSKLQASRSATGKPRISNTVVNVSVQDGRCKAGSTTDATWTSNQPTTA